MEKKRILFVYYSMIVGGSTTSLLSVLNCLDREKYDIDLLLYKHEGPMMPYIPEDVHLLPEASLNYSALQKAIKFVFSIYSFRSVFVKLTQKKIGFSDQVLSDFQVKKLSKPVDKKYDIAVGFIEGWSDRYVADKVWAATKIGWLHAPFASIAEVSSLESWMNKVDKIVTVSQKCKDDFCARVPHMASKAVFYENIIDSDLIIKRSLLEDADDRDFVEFKNSNSFKIITVCRLDMASKGLDRAINCATQLREDGYNFLWFVVGDGPDRQSLESLIQKYNLEGFFRLTGNRFNPYPFIKEADIFCMPSRWEGKPIAVTESMILGVPPVVTEYMSAKEQIEDGVDGLIAANGDDTIYEKVKYCIDNIDIVNQMKTQLLSREYGNAGYIRKLEDELFI